MQDINTQKNENEIKEKKTAKEKTVFILKIVGNVIFYIIIVALLLFSIMNINAGSKNGGFPNLFGKGFLSVQTDSMERSDKLGDLEEWSEYKIQEINKGDLVYVTKFTKSDCQSLKVGDVITFYDDELESLNTHRIVYIMEDSKSVITQGDKSAELRPYKKDDPFGENAQYNAQLEQDGAVETVNVSNIRGVVTGVSRGAGKVIDNIQKNWLWYFVLPVLAFLLFEIFMVVRNIMELKGAKQQAALATDKEAMLADIEAQKEEMRKQILAELKAQQSVSPATDLQDKISDEEETEDRLEEDSISKDSSEILLEEKENTDIKPE